MKARFYGVCPIPPSSEITVKRWYMSIAGYFVLLSCTDRDGVVWVGPEFPLNMASAHAGNVETRDRRFSVESTTVDSIQGWTEFILGEIT